MSEEIAKTGKKMDFVIVNKDDAEAQVSALIQKCKLPIYQDTTKIGAWKEMAGGKDDFFLYGSDGKLVHHLPFGGAIGTNLSNAKEFEAVKGLAQSLK